MAKNCIKCGQKEGFTDANYAGFNVTGEGSYSFPGRIMQLILPGKKDIDFLCRSCANKSKVECKVHGIIKNDSFDWKRPPKCIKCETQLNSINDAILPEGFWGLIPLDQIITKSGDNIDSGYLGFSDDGKVHFIREKVLFSSEINSIVPKIIVKKKQLVLVASAPDSCYFDYGYKILKDKAILKSFSGSWFNFWKESVLKLLEIENQTNYLGIVSSESKTPAVGKIGELNKKYNVVICALINGQLKTIPNIELPSLELLKSWYIEADCLELLYNINGVPQYFRLIGLEKTDGFDPISKLKQGLPAFSKSDKLLGTNFSSLGIFNVTLYPSNTQHKALIEISHKKVTSTILPDEKRLSFTKGFTHCNTSLLITDDFAHSLTVNLKGDSDRLSNTITAPKKLKQFQDYKLGIFLDKEYQTTAHTLKIFGKGFVFNNDDPINFSCIKKIKLENKTSKICTLIINYIYENQERTIKLSSPEPLAYKVWETIEVRTLDTKLNPKDTIDLYQNYNKLKKDKLLIGLYADIILFNKELNRTISMEELASKVGPLSSNEFYEKRELYLATTEKILLISNFLPKIKQNFEYLATFYPYFQLRGELDFISEAFSQDIAQKVAPFEKKRILPSSRRNVRNVQLDIQRIFSEIEKAIHPVEQILAKEEIQKTISSMISRHMATGGQLFLIGSLVATGVATAGVGLLAGMLGVRAFGDLLNKFQKNREAATMIKKSFETVFSWWQVFLNQLPVSIFEVGEQISEENNKCMMRDKKILSQYPSDNKEIVFEKLNKALHNRIAKIAKKQFHEIIDGSEIRFISISKDMEFANENNVNKKISTALDSLALPQL